VSGELLSQEGRGYSLLGSTLDQLLIVLVVHGYQLIAQTAPSNV
jgi:hypothetical protein